MANHLRAGLLTFAEFANKTTQYIVDADESAFDDCLAAVPSEVVGEYANHLRDFLVPVDFMPSPHPFIVGAGTAEERAAVQARLRPKYIRLYQAVCARASEATTHTDVGPAPG